MNNNDKLEKNISKIKDFDFDELDYNLFQKKFCHEIESHKTCADKLLHFIWIGIPDDKALLYLNVWAHHYPNYKINLWIDSKYLYANKYKEKLKNKCKNTKILNLLKKQDLLYSYYKKSKFEKKSFDILINNFLEKGFLTKINKEDDIKKIIEKFHFLNVIDIRDHDDVISKELEGYYEKEIVLRANFAAASDISRICILKKFGGVYLDVDTLPCLDYVFKSSRIYSDCSFYRNEYIDIYKSQLYLNKYNKDLNLNVDIDKFVMDIDLITNITSVKYKIENYLKLIRYDIYNHNIDKFNSQPFMLYKNLLMIGASKVKLNTFYNNILVSEKGGRLVSIILREITKRYRHIESNGYDRWESIKSYNTVYKNGNLERLIGYRLDGLANIPNTTVILTGPCMILEVYLKITYHVLKLNEKIDPRKVASLYQLDQHGITCKNVVTFTLENSKSTWM
ncbi:TcdA/TcdB catalytic glycosyltransferase domain-containing protein [Vibrio vulnificus]|uniref:TcdA/TcdB catalytic glycosyltransferase domain-containing protein n=1 Tax=Vibrio vulnificus TaxID=672 RepID=UPI001A31A362|nr:TcdA/TcdB catalytic glycosyltransferase domain-containing protein [Vibrio vulnificus]MCG8704035.1 hypothetical protein [Vibrio vulnificus]MCG8704044.1 hypothetical protein [Vibrio vulnificus]HAS8156211.1 hypothetical protein [Vibrio vulnificus]